MTTSLVNHATLSFAGILSRLFEIRSFSMTIILSFLFTMFSSLGLFKQIQCPEQSHCSLSNCIFAHHSAAAVAKDVPQNPSTSNSTHGDTLQHERPRKRRRIANDGNDTNVDELVPDSPRDDSAAIDPQDSASMPSRLPWTASRDVSPPPLRSSKAQRTSYLSPPDVPNSASSLKQESNPTVPPAPAKKTVEETLNPRMMTNPPAGHGIRMQLLHMIHEQMTRLNEEISQSQDSSKSTLLLSPPEIVLEALEEEETVAKRNPAVYSNVIKLRIVKLRKMKLAEWKEERLKQIAKRAPVKPSTIVTSIPKSIETGLTSSQEIAFLSRILAKQSQLSKFGYVPAAPSEEEVNEARKGVDAAQGWELCDRCKTRFQVFPGRRAEDGALTSGGRCNYHPAKPRRPQPTDKADKVNRDSIYACCSENVGQSSGCTVASTHVFKISEPKRLGLIMPFEETPRNSQASELKRAVAFDCEMGYTTMGLELIRLTATSWPTGEELLDVLVRPLGEVLDLNSRFSGVFPQDYKDAIPYDSDGAADKDVLDADGKPRLRLVDSPFAARTLLFSLITPSTPLIGHALDNDLNATRIIHPSIVDSVLLYPHPRGLPLRFGLKVLMKKHLDRDIQTGGAQGHDSKEDARAAGDLVRLKIAEMWKTMKKEGWTVEDDVFCPPTPGR